MSWLEGLAVVGFKLGLPVGMLVLGNEVTDTSAIARGATGFLEGGDVGEGVAASRTKVIVSTAFEDFDLEDFAQ